MAAQLGEPATRYFRSLVMSLRLAIGGRRKTACAAGYLRVLPF